MVEKTQCRGKLFEDTESFAREVWRIGRKMNKSSRNIRILIAHEIAHYRKARELGCLPQYELAIDYDDEKEEFMLEGGVYTNTEAPRINLAVSLAPKTLGLGDLKMANTERLKLRELEENVKTK